MCIFVIQRDIDILLHRGKEGREGVITSAWDERDMVGDLCKIII